MKCFYKVALFALAFFGFVACGGGYSSPEACAEAVMQYIVDGKADKAIEMMRDKDGKPIQGQDKATVNSKIPMMRAQYEAAGKIKSIKAKETIYNDEKTKAKVIVQVEFENGEFDGNGTDWAVALIDGKWYVQVQ
ncbi:DUF4878 domain-containing protein [Helicobacter sp. T3_23-1056]